MSDAANDRGRVLRERHTEHEPDGIARWQTRSSCPHEPCVLLAVQVRIAEHVDTLGVHIHGDADDELDDLIREALISVRDEISLRRVLVLGHD